MEKEEYEKIYGEFIKNYSSGATTAEQAGFLVAQLAGYYPNYLSSLVKTERNYALICRDEILKSDDMTGKAVSGVKAEKISDASDEAYAFKIAKSHVLNLEMLIQSAKSLQRGLSQEMSYAGLQ